MKYIRKTVSIRKRRSYRDKLVSTLNQKNKTSSKYSAFCAHICDTLPRIFTTLTVTCTKPRHVCTIRWLFESVRYGRLVLKAKARRWIFPNMANTGRASLIAVAALLFYYTCILCLGEDVTAEVIIIGAGISGWFCFLTFCCLSEA